MLYELTCPDNFDDSVVYNAPSPGVAIEYYLASHGMFGYKEAFRVRETIGPISPWGSLDELLAIIPDAHTESRCAELDEHHIFVLE